MPIYDYRCQQCRRRCSLLFQTYAAAEHAACPHCGSRDLTRLVTRFAVMKSEERRLEDLADSSFGDLDENDPASVARFMKKMGKELGDDLGDDFDSAIDEAMAESEGEGGEGSESTESLGASGSSDDL